MATSGTIGQTRINVMKMLEKAVLRCGISPVSITPELVDSAKEALFMLLTSLSTRGLNLWCIDKQLISTVVGQATYVLPAGTTDILNMMQATPNRVSGTNTVMATSFATTLSSVVGVVRIGVKFSILPTTSFTFEKSVDGVTYTPVEVITDLPEVNAWGWYDIDPCATSAYFRVSFTSGTCTDLFLSDSVREITMSQFNRDDYANQPNKTTQSETSTNFYFEKLVNPQATVWPVPKDDTRHFVLFRYRQIQDVGSLTNELELPSRWAESITWHWSLRLAFEIPEVTPDRRKEVQAMAASMVIEVEAGETDSAPTYFAPRIGVYTR